MSSLLRRVLQRRGEGRRRCRSKCARKRRRFTRRTNGDGDDSARRIRRFQTWCGEAGIVLHEDLCIVREGSRADIGVVAGRAITRGVVLARIPRASLLSALNCEVGAALRSDRAFRRKMRTVNSWVPLLLALLAEKGKKTSSFWWPYLTLVPSKSSPGPALQWSPRERSQLLQGTGVEERVQRDLANIERDYHDIVLPFMQRHPELYQKTSHSLQLYKDLVCFVMAYSFTDSEEAGVCGQTMMVPFVDLLNHHSVHHAELSFLPSHLELVAVRNIQQGSEVMNTYGPLSNASLLHVYGFTEEGNPHDVALVQSSTVLNIYSGLGGSHDTSCDQRWERLRGDVSEEEFEVDACGQPEPGLIAAVKLLLVEEERYDLMRDHLMTDEDLCLESMSEVEKDFLTKVCRACLASLPEVAGAKRQEMEDKERFARQLTLSQRLCLSRLEKALGTL